MHLVENNALLKVEELRTWFPVRGGLFAGKTGDIKAVDGVSFTLGKQRTLGLVGESGCGKTTLGRSIIRLVEPTGGRVEFDGEDILGMGRSALRGTRRKMQIIFQDPYASLNPRMTVGRIVAEPLEIHDTATGSALEERVMELLAQVGLRPEHAGRYPHEFSGGQRQRIGIARAIALNPSFIVGDEPVSALDVSVRAQVLNLLQRIQEEFHIAYLFISHDLSVIRHISDNVAVMYLGRIVEEAPRDELFKNPVHPYTEALLASIPVPDPARKSGKIVLTGDLPSPANPPSGCHFHTRCPFKKRECETVPQKLKDVSSPSATGRHRAACMVRVP